MLSKSLFFITTLFFSLSLQAFSLGDAASALSAVESATNTEKKVSTTSAEANKDNGLIGMLTSQLGITDTQASGGVGSILNYAKGSLSNDDYSTLEKAIPDASSMISTVAKSDDSSSALGSIAGSLAGNDSSTSGLMSLASNFSSLDMDTSMISKFVPIIINYLQSSNSGGAANILAGLF